MFLKLAIRAYWISATHNTANFYSLTGLSKYQICANEKKAQIGIIHVRRIFRKTYISYYLILTHLCKILAYERDNPSIFYRADSNKSDSLPLHFPALIYFWLSLCFSWNSFKLFLWAFLFFVAPCLYVSFCTWVCLLQAKTNEI